MFDYLGDDSTATGEPCSGLVHSEAALSDENLSGGPNYLPTTQDLFITMRIREDT